MHDEDLHAIFVEETSPLAAEVQDRLLRLEQDAAALHAQWRELLGVLHTVKGNCGMVGYDDAQALAHAMEDRVREVRRWAPEAQPRAAGELLAAADALCGAVAARDAADEGARLERGRIAALPATPSSGDDEAPPPRALAPVVDAPAAHVRIPAGSLDRLLEAAVDLSTLHVRLRGALAPRGHRDPQAEALLGTAEAAGRRVDELRRAVLDLRLVPLSTVTHRYPRMIRDLCQATGKLAALEVRGGDVGADKHVVEQLAEPLLHILRNAVDHGVEPPRDRVRAGKPERATIIVEIRAQGGLLQIAVRDDGRGIDPARLVEAAARRGIDATGWTDEQVLELVFAPDLSTAATVTSLSGRGVGLDQARRSIERIGGSLTIASARGEGTELRLRVPLVAAVQRALIVACGDELFALPFTTVLETAMPDAHPEPLQLSEQLGLALAPAPPPAPRCILVETGAAPVALVVDALLGHEDLMIRELDDVFGRPAGVHGAALLGDGRIVTVLDPAALVRHTRAEVMR